VFDGIDKEGFNYPVQNHQKIAEAGEPADGEPTDAGLVVQQ